MRWRSPSTWRPQASNSKATTSARCRSRPPPPASGNSRSASSRSPAAPNTMRTPADRGGQASGPPPAELTHRVSVAPPVALPDIRELIDRRAIPEPQPDGILYVSLEDAPDGQRLAYHVTCPALGE